MVGSCGEKAGLIEPPPPAPTDIDRARTPDDRAAEQIAAIRGHLAGEPAVTVKGGGVTVTFYAPQRLLVAEGRGGVRRAVRSDGQAFQATGRGCYSPAGRAPVPRADSAVLPLSGGVVAFSKAQRDGDRDILPFTADALGSYGPGKGTLVVDGRQPLSFSYRPEGRRRTITFKVSYPGELSPPDLQTC